LRDGKGVDLGLLLLLLVSAGECIEKLIAVVRDAVAVDGLSRGG
jgi:hypothetical protein